MINIQSFILNDSMKNKANLAEMLREKIIAIKPFNFFLNYTAIKIWILGKYSALEQHTQQNGLDF